MRINLCLNPTRLKPDTERDMAEPDKGFVAYGVNSEAREYDQEIDEIKERLKAMESYIKEK